MAFPWGGIGTVVGSLLSNRGAKRRQQQADAKNIEFWKMQNEYNTPKAQMQRLRDAGLNPALIYGSGQTNTGVAGSVAPSKPAPYNIKDPIPQTLAAMATQSQINLQNSQAAKIDSEKNQIDQLVGGKVTDLNLRNAINTVKKDVQQATTEKQKKSIIAAADIKGFEATIKSEDANMATQGFIKGNYIGTIFKQLGLDPTNPTDKLIIQGMIYSLFGSQVIKNLSGPMKAAIEAFRKQFGL